MYKLHSPNLSHTYFGIKWFPHDGFSFMPTEYFVSLTTSFLRFSSCLFHTIKQEFMILCCYIHTYYSHTPRVHMYIYAYAHTIAHTDFFSGDYTSVSMTLGPFTSQQPRQCFTVSVTDDTFVELNETFTARLTLIDSSVTTISANRIIVDPPQTTVQITDNDLSKCSTSTRSQAQTTHVYTCEGMDD